MNSTILNSLVWPAVGLLYPALVHILGQFLPLDKEIVHVKSLDQPVEYWQYPIINFIGLVEQHGYIAEEFNVTTSDGYILRLHRISGSLLSPKASGKPAIYIQHGIFLSSDSWVLIGPDSDLAFLLADKGYDVWIGNVRGNAYSRAHVFKNPNDDDFWDFSYHEMAIYDLPAIIDRILVETGAKKLTYFGYSMGTTIGYVLVSMLPKYNEKINLIYNIAPVVFWNHELKRLIALVDFIFDELKSFLTHFNIRELLPRTALAAYIGKYYCSNDDMITQPLCVGLISNIGLDPQRFNKTALPNILAHFPAGTSTLNVYHYNQNYKQDKFAAYDYGSYKNFKKYGSITPPIYNVSKVIVPVKILYALNDDIVNEKDVFELAKRLPNVKSVDSVKNKKFNHFDFLWAMDARQLVYDIVVTSL